MLHANYNTQVICKGWFSAMVASYLFWCSNLTTPPKKCISLLFTFFSSFVVQHESLNIEPNAPKSSPWCAFHTSLPVSVYFAACLTDAPLSFALELTFLPHSNMSSSRVFVSHTFNGRDMQTGHDSTAPASYTARSRA